MQETAEEYILYERILRLASDMEARVERVLERIGEINEIDIEIRELNEDCRNYVNFLRRLNQIDLNAMLDEIESRGLIDDTLFLHLLKFLVEIVQNKNKEIRELRRQQTLQEKEIHHLKQENNGCRTKYKQVNERYEELKQSITESIPPFQQAEIRMLSSIDDFYAAHLKVQEKNMNAKGPTGHTFPKELRPFYVLLSFAGEFWYNLLVNFMGFPCWRQVQYFRKQMLEEYGIDGIDFLDGSPDLIARLKDSLWKDKGEDNDMRCVIAIDAASVNPQVSISPEGKIIGFTEDGPQQVSPEEAKQLRSDSKAYKRFIKKNLQYVIKYEFIALLCPLDPDQVVIPISSIEANSGSATQEIKEHLEALRTNASEVGFDVIGYAFDGDRQYLDLTEDIWTEYIGLFYDMLHSVKCDRYRKSKDKDTCVWPTCGEATINPDELSKYVPSECLDDRKAAKMHDDLPLKMFTPENCHKAYMDHSYDICLSLLPSTYLIEAAMNDDLSREERLNYLTIGFCIMVLYYDDAISERMQDQSHRNNEVVPYHLFNIDFAFKYIGCAWSLSTPITGV